MDRRKMLTSAGAIAAAGVFAGMVQGQEKSRSATAIQSEHKHNTCIDTCSHCETICNETAKHCLMQLSKGKGEHANAAAITLSCEEFCGLSAKLIARSSSLMKIACEACAKACEACAAECEKIETDEQMILCAKACRECATTCRTMA